MDDLGEYPDSPEEREMPAKGKRPPPPSGLVDTPAGKRQCVNRLQLPQVVPVQPREDKFLVHVYLPVAHPKLDAFVRRLMGMARLRLTGGKIKAAFTPLTDFHVSIARPVAIPEAQIRGLVADLANAMRHCSRVQIGIRSSVKGFASGNGHRVFVAAPLTTATGRGVVKGLINAVDTVYETRGLPVFFEDPKPHMSFAWTEVIDTLLEFRENDSTPSVGEEDVLDLFADKVECSIGMSKYYFILK